MTKAILFWVFYPKAHVYKVFLLCLMGRLFNNFVWFPKTILLIPFWWFFSSVWVIFSLEGHISIQPKCQGDPSSDLWCSLFMQFSSFGTLFSKLYLFSSSGPLNSVRPPSSEVLLPVSRSLSYLLSVSNTVLPIVQYVKTIISYILSDFLVV